jgi:hypothetical protein
MQVWKYYMIQALQESNVQPSECSFSFTTLTIHAFDTLLNRSQCHTIPSISIDVSKV